MLTKLCNYLDTRPEPVLLVFYGDHLPALGQDYGVYQELGLPIGMTDTSAHVLETYETPYLIWANEAYAPDCDLTRSSFRRPSAQAIWARRCMS